MQSSQICALILNLYHFLRRIDTVPWFPYDAVEEDVNNVIDEMTAYYEDSIGKTINQVVGQHPSVEGEGLGTLKAHHLRVHLIEDIKAGEFLTNFDAQAGESHHVQTRAHFGRTSRREDAGEKVARRSTAREPGLFQMMYPVEATGELKELLDQFKSPLC